MIHTTFKSVENGITCCCNLGGLKIRRKTRTPDTGKISWWFVIHADEAVLCELASKWESVNLQTFWQLQTCLKPAVVIEEETDADDTGIVFLKSNPPVTPLNRPMRPQQTLPQLPLFPCRFPATLLCLAPPTLHINVNPLPFLETTQEVAPSQ